MSYRPISDMWMLARPKLKGGKKFYGAYPAGFPERARVLIGCDIKSSVLHVCSGMAFYYPYKRGFGEYDGTLDINPSLKPDYCRNAEEFVPNGFQGMIIDPPYSEEDAKKYGYPYPNPNKILKNAINALPVGRKAGILHYIIPQCPKNAKFLACVGVFCGFNNRIRAFSVYERIV